LEAGKASARMERVLGESSENRLSETFPRNFRWQQKGENRVVDGVTAWQRFRAYSEADLANHVRETLETPNTGEDAGWQDWLISFCLSDLRPHTLTANGKAWCRWIAFVLRYIQPLLAQTAPVETKPLVQVMRSRTDLLRVLMFGSPEALRDSLPGAYEIRADYRDTLSIPDVTPQQEAFFQEVLKEIQTADARTLTGWSRYYLDAPANRLARNLYEKLHTGERLTLSTLISTATTGQRASDQQFQAYLTRVTRDPARTSLVPMVVGYVNEAERRAAVLRTYARWFNRASVALFPLLVLGILLFRISDNTAVLAVAAILSTLGLLDVGFVLILLALLVATAFDTFTWTNAALKTLEMVVGSTP